MAALRKICRGIFHFTIGSYHDFIIIGAIAQLHIKTFGLLNKYTQYPEAPLESTGMPSLSLGSLLPVLPFFLANIYLMSLGCGTCAPRDILSSSPGGKVKNDQLLVSLHQGISQEG